MIQKVELEIAKELSDIAKLPAYLISEIKTLKGQGKSIGEITSELGPKLVGIGIAALDKADQVDDEYDANRKVFMATCGYHGGELVDALMPAKTAVVKLPA